MLRDFKVGGQRSGQTLKLTGDSELQAELEWTFPLKFAEIVSGDGQKVFRERIDLTETEPFGKRKLSRHLDFRGRKWARFEVWDVAANGAFTQPV